jgi:hypothetical protein
VKQCTWNSFIGDVIGELSGPDKRFRRPPDTFIIHSAKLAAAELIVDSNLLRDTLCVPAQCGVKEYPLYIPDGRELMAVQYVSIDGRKKRGWRYIEDDGMVVFTTAPDMMATEICIGYSYSMDISGCAEMPEFLCRASARIALKYYTLKTLFGMPEQDWYNPMLHQMYRADAVNYATKLSKQAAGSGQREPSNGSELEEKFWKM